MNDNQTRPDVEGILARADAATEGPWILERFFWKVGSKYPGSDRWWWEVGADALGTVVLCDDADEEPNADLAFIAAARTDVPALARYVLALEAQVADSRAETERLRRDCDGLRQIASIARRNHFAAEARAERAEDSGMKLYDIWNGTQNVNWIRGQIRYRWPSLGAALDGAAQPAEPTTGREEGEQ